MNDFGRESKKGKKKKRGKKKRYFFHLVKIYYSLKNNKLCKVTLRSFISLWLIFIPIAIGNQDRVFCVFAGYILSRFPDTKDYCFNFADKTIIKPYCLFG
jgi:hypothetical protein